jgi:hypothetical protein
MPDKLDRWLEENTAPMARGRVVKGGLIKTCPVCGREFRERTDRWGEMTTNKYADHYQKEHMS